MKNFIGIAGTTCVGKSAVAVSLARLLCADVISADSMQIYRGMDIGTAKISKAEQQGVKHFMIDIITPNMTFSSFEYAQMASKIIDSEKKAPVVVGGTGFYFDSLLYPPEFGGGSPERRKQLQQIYLTKGLSALQEILSNLDKESFDSIDINNPTRVIRAIEIAENGQQRVRGKGKIAPQFSCNLYILRIARESLYKKIDERVDSMIKNGLVDEVDAMIKTYGFCDTSAYSAIGYKEIIEYLEERCSLEEAIAKIKLNTRHYAKRQSTYFKKMDVKKFIDVDGYTSDEIARMIFEEETMMNVQLSES